MIIAIDFDGTVVTHEFPNIGKDIGAVPVLKKLVEAGHKLILWTMRSDIEEVKTDDLGLSPKAGKHLTNAVNWFKENGIELYGINENPTQKSWTKSPKAYAEMYIDDAALGCVLEMDLDLCKRPFVSWRHIDELFEKSGMYLKNEGN